MTLLSFLSFFSVNYNCFCQDEEICLIQFIFFSKYLSKIYLFLISHKRKNNLDHYFEKYYKIPKCYKKYSHIKPMLNQWFFTYQCFGFWFCCGTSLNLIIYWNWIYCHTSEEWTLSTLRKSIKFQMDEALLILWN